MYRLKQIGTVSTKKAADIKESRLGIGFEKLDRDAFDPEKAYDKLANIGVKWVRLQSGWQKTEKQKGVYDFAWLDLVEYIDNSVIAQMSVPDMRACVQYALSYPERTKAIIPELDLAKLMTLSFGRPDTKTFSLLESAFYAAKKGGALPAVLNAANEVAVAKFLSGKIRFGDITESVNEVLYSMENSSAFHDIDDILLADKEAREKTERALALK